MKKKEGLFESLSCLRRLWLRLRFKRWPFILLLVLLASSLPAQAWLIPLSQITGREWAGLSQEEKLLFSQGIILGTYLTAISLIMEERESLQTVKSHVLNRISPQELAFRLDLFYSEQGNFLIPVLKALYLLRGRP